MAICPPLNDQTPSMWEAAPADAAPMAGSIAAAITSSSDLKRPERCSLHLESLVEGLRRKGRRTTPTTSDRREFFRLGLRLGHMKRAKCLDLEQLVDGSRCVWPLV